MIEAEVWNAFSAAVTAFAVAASPPIPVIHQGVHGTPPDDGVWLETRFFPNKPENYGLPNQGPTAHRGMCQVSVCYRPGAGIVNGLEVGGAVVEAFAKGTALGRAKVNVKPSISSVLTQPERVSHPVTIPYLAIIQG